MPLLSVEALQRSAWMGYEIHFLRSMYTPYKGVYTVYTL